MNEPSAGSIRRTRLLAYGVLAAAALVLVATYIPDQPTLSPYDEWVYVDYVDKMTQLDIPQQGELIDTYALQIASCRGVFVWGTIGSPCGGPYESLAYPLQGVTSADIHPPTYFGATAGFAAAMRGVGLSDDLLTSARAVGAVWLFLGLSAIFLLARDLGASSQGAVGASLLIASLPLVRLTNSYITPDALNLAVGGAVLLAALRTSRGTWPWWSMAIVGFFAGAVKTQNVLVVAAAAVFLLWAASRDRTQAAGRRLALGVGAVSLGFLVPQIGWLVVRRLASLSESPDTAAEGALTGELMLREMTAFVFRLGLGDLQPVPVYAHFLTAVIIAGCLGAVLYRSVRDERWGMGTSVMLLLIIGSPILLLTQYVAFGEVTAAPNRYGGSLLAGMGAVTATAFASRRRGWLLCGIGIAAVATVLVDNLAR